MGFRAHAMAATLLRVVLALGPLASIFEHRIEVSTPITAVGRYREALQLDLLGLSPYAGGVFHGPPLLLAAVQTIDWILKACFGYLALLAGMPPLGAGTALEPFFRTVMASTADVLAAWALRWLAMSCTVSPNGKAATFVVPPDNVAALYLWNPLVVAAALAGSTGGLENAAVFVALAAASSGNAKLSAAALVAALYLGLHPILLAVPIVLLLWRGPENLACQPPPSSPPALKALSTADSDDSASRKTKATREQIESKQQGVEAETHNSSTPTVLPPHPSRRCPNDQRDSSDTEQPEGMSLPPSPPPPGALSNDNPEIAGGICQGSSTAERAQPSQITAAIINPQQQQQLQARFYVRFRDRRRHGGIRKAASFVAWLVVLGVAALALSDLALRNSNGHKCSNLLRRVLPSDRMNCNVGGGPHSSGKGGRHWTRHVYGTMLVLDDLTPNIGLHWYFFAEMFEVFRPLWHFVFGAMVAAAVVPVAIRLPHRPLTVAVMQSCATALLKPYPSVTDISQYLALLPLLSCQLESGGFPAAAMVAVGALIAVLAPPMWHMWVYLGSANANFYYAVTLAFGAWQALLILNILSATIRFDRILSGKSLVNW